jgi:parvulin-like peptidyl-prolyl isomerase
MRLHRLTLLLVACSAVLLAACGGSGEKDSLQSGSDSAAASSAAESTGAAQTGATSAAESGTGSAATTGAETGTTSSGVALPTDLQPGELGDNEVANVAGKGITKDEFDHLLEIARAQQKSQGGEVPKAGTPEDDALRRQVMQVLVQNAIITSEAERQGVTVDEAKVTTELTDFKTQCCQGKDDEYQKYLKDSAASEQDLKDQLTVRQLAQTLYDKVTGDVSVTDDEISAQYDKDKETRYTTQESRRVAHILIDVDPTGKVDAKDLAKANEVLALVKKGDDFGELAKKYSADPGSKDSGGEYDDVKGTFVPEFEKAAFALETGKFTEKPVKSTFGYHIIKALEDTKPARVQPLSEVKDAIKEELETSAKDTAANDWFQQLLAGYEAKTVFAPGYGLPPKADTSGTLPEGTSVPSDTAATDTGATATDDTSAATEDTASTDDTASSEDTATGATSSDDATSTG